jgi:hypothetical protein
MNEHEKIIVDFINKNPGWKRYKLRKSINEAIRTLDDDGEWYEPFPLVNYIPDAFYVDKENRTVHLLEVDGTSGTSKRKLERMDNLWFYLDCEEWCLTLTSISVHSKAVSLLTDQDFVNLHYSKYEEPGEIIKSLFHAPFGPFDDYCPRPQITF